MLGNFPTIKESNRDSKEKVSLMEKRHLKRPEVGIEWFNKLNTNFRIRVIEKRKPCRPNIEVKAGLGSMESLIGRS